MSTVRRQSARIAGKAAPAAELPKKQRRRRRPSGRRPPEPEPEDAMAVEPPESPKSRCAKRGVRFEWVPGLVDDEHRNGHLHKACDYDAAGACCEFEDCPVCYDQMRSDRLYRPERHPVHAICTGCSGELAARAGAAPCPICRFEDYISDDSEYRRAAREFARVLKERHPAWWANPVKHTATIFTQLFDLDAHWDDMRNYQLQLDLVVFPDAADATFASSLGVEVHVLRDGTTVRIEVTHDEGRILELLRMMFDRRAGFDTEQHGDEIAGATVIRALPWSLQQKIEESVAARADQTSVQQLNYALIDYASEG